MYLIKLIIILLLFQVIYGCLPPSTHRDGLASNKEQEMTVGLAQREIKVGMTQADVAAVLGSPNIVTNNDDKETWVYDKVASEASYSDSKGGVGTGLIIGLIGGASYSGQSGASSSTQKTLTIIIGFDLYGKVEKLKYHSSKF